MNDREMRGIIDIEKIFHLPFAALSVIERERNERKERVFLMDIRNGKEDEGDHAKRELCPFVFAAEIYENRDQYTPDAVIDRVIRFGQEKRQNIDEEKDGDKYQSEKHPGIDVFACHRKIERIDQQDGEGKRDERALEKGIHREKAEDLKDCAEAEHQEKIFFAVSRIARSLRDHIGEDRERKTPKDAHPLTLGI